MIPRDYRTVLLDVATECGKRAAALGDACELAQVLGDDVAAAGYLGQIHGINTVLEIINDSLGD